MVDTASLTEITLSRCGTTRTVLVGITEVEVRKVGGDGLIEDQSAADAWHREMTSNGQSKFTFIAPSRPGVAPLSSSIRTRAANNAVTAQLPIIIDIGAEEAVEPEPEAPMAPSLGAFSGRRPASRW